MYMTMKYKSIIFAALSIGVMAGVSSCEDMLKTESSVVMYDKEDNLSNATDTVYSVLGIIQKMQKIADRTILLGELRGDLVSTTDYATSDLKELGSFSGSIDNKYNNAVDYYAIINNCNYYLSHADTTYMRGGKSVFRNEYVAVLAFRAWTYMQLGQIYGKVPFVTEPIVSGDKADLSNYPLRDIKYIAQQLIPDLVGNEDTPFPNYGEISIGQLKLDSRKFFLPIRLVLGDLCLWAGEGYYADAAKYYHDYLSSLKQNVPTTTQGKWWISAYFNSTLSSYQNAFTEGPNNRDRSQIAYIPMESEDYNGVVSDLDNIFESTVDNDYYCQATASSALRQLSADQIYCYAYYPTVSKNEVRARYVLDTEKYPTKPVPSTADSVILFERNEIPNSWLRGDLRLYSIIDISTLTSDMANYSTSYQTLEKISTDRICLYRNDVVYLRLAEAMNRAGLPEMAFLVLKYGLCQDNILTKVSASERAKATMLGLTEFNSNRFSPAVLDYVEGFTSIYEPAEQNRPKNTIGIHSRGSGISTYNDFYVIPACANLSDSIKAVEEMIVDEMALETCFEGYRFGDLMRVSMHRAEQLGGFADNEFLAKRISKRDASLYSKLNNGGNGYNSNWFLPLP